MKVRGGQHSSFEGSWGSTSTCSSTCTGVEGPITLQPSWAPHIDSPWSLRLDLPPSWGPPPPQPSVLPTSPQRIDVVRGARGRRPSVVANLLREGGTQSRYVPRRGSRPEVDVGAFHRYYEGSTLGGAPSPATPRGESGGVRICGSSDTLGGTLASLGVILPTKLEALLKLLAQSLHLVLAALCSRKARRKDRECSTHDEHKLYLEEAVLERNIPETDLKQLVDLPPGLGYEEWLASHTIDFFHHINLLYGTVCEFCTLTGCPDMTGPGLRQYLWFDEKGKKTRVAAPQYVDYVMTFTQNTVNDETIFPTKFDNDFPSSFESIVKKIHRLLFHVVAHLYHAHFREVVLLSLHSHLNCLFAHFVLFNEKFRLVDEKETEILHDLVVALKIHPEIEISNSSTNTTTSFTTESSSINPSTTSTTTATTTTTHLHSETCGGSSYSNLMEDGCSPSACSASPNYNILNSDTLPLTHLSHDNSPYHGDERVTSVTATVTQVTAESDPIGAPFVDRGVTLTDALP